MFWSSGLINDEELWRVLRSNPSRQKIVITRKNNLNDLRNTRTIYLSKVSRPGYFDPSKLYVLEQNLWRHLQNSPSDVILDAFEYLAIENGLETALKFTGKLRDMAVLTGSRFYVTVSDALEERTIHLLRRILD
ncbi:hypothetical protein A3L08_09050 [Thermococcus pacificus]|uniref:DUF835 domain-containing protein n=1 Tax=Thermococcus pacificus TaxID=71998 RepID=A0A218P9J4_9EURY|nr:hypothetical protein A3L08_09050 [Thermococcus pacificus]